VDHVDDLRGKTTFRELFYLISNVEFMLANEGAIASAFNTMSYVVFAGFISANVCEKSPCWLLKDCGI